MCVHVHDCVSENMCVCVCERESVYHCVHACMHQCCVSLCVCVCLRERECVCVCVCVVLVCTCAYTMQFQRPTNGGVLDLSRYYAGQKEYEVELQFSSGLTSHPDRLKTGWEDNRDGEDPVPGSSSDVSSEFGASQG